MKNSYALIASLLIVGYLFGTGNAKLTNPNLNAQAQQFVFPKKQLGFQENKGQMADIDGKPTPYVLFKAEATNLNVWVTTTGLTYQFLKTEEQHNEKEIGNRQLAIGNEQQAMGNGQEEKDKNIKTEWHRVDMILKGASIEKENIITEGDITQGDVNYYLGHCPNGILNVKTYTKIIIKEIYPGIDWVLYTSLKRDGGGLKHDFIVHPRADPNQIKLIYEGSGKLNVTNNQIHFKNKLGEITEGELLCYQGRESNSITSDYTIKETGRIIPNGFSDEIGIKTGNYNPNATLTIDPQIVWGTFYGTSLLDMAHVADTDKNGNLLVGGYTYSSIFPTQTTSTFFQGMFGGVTDAIILKFNNTGVLLWATYYGGNYGEQVYSIATDNSSNIFVTGTTLSTNFPVQNAGAGTYYQPVGVSYDGFILKFSSTGTRLWATYYGGSQIDAGRDIAIDNGGNMFITGTTKSPNFPVLNASTYFQGVFGGPDDAFISKFSNSGVLLWSTFYNYCVGNSITTDIIGNVFVSGTTFSSVFQIQNASTFFQPANGGGQDAFILKFDNNGNRLWATFYGGSSNDYSYGIDSDNSGNVFVHGHTASTNFPTFNAGTYFQPLQGGPSTTSDAFILKFSNTGVRLWATLYGGNNTEAANRDELAIDNCGNVYLGIPTTSSDFPTYNSNACNYYDNSYGNGFYDNALVMFDNNGNRLWASYFGDYGYDYGVSLATDANNNLFMIGSEYRNYTVGTPSFIINPGGGAYFDNTFNGDGDIFISKFIPTPLTLTQSQVNATVCNPCNGSATINLTCSEPNYSYVWSNGSSILNSTNATNTITGLCPGTYMVTATSNCNQTQTATFVITGTSCGSISANVNSVTICSGTTPCPTLTATGTSGTVPYTYLWSTGATTQNNTPSPCPVVNTIYTVTITDNAGITASSTAVVTVNSAVSLTATPANISCSGGTNGSAIANATNGTPVYIYSWSNGGTTSQISNLTSQIYTITVTDSKGCTSTATAAIISPPPFIGQFTKGAANCPGCGCKEWIMVNATGGINPYSYVWPDGYVNRYKNQLCPGTYTINIKDKNGCSVNVNLSVP